MPTSPPFNSWLRLPPSWPRLGQLPAMLLRCAGKLNALLVHGNFLLEAQVLFIMCQLVARRNCMHERHQVGEGDASQVLQTDIAIG